MSRPTQPPTVPRAPARGNRLLAALAVLAPADAAWIEPHLHTVTFGNGEMLAAAGQSFEHAYFPLTAVVSIISRMANGSAAEVGTVGNEGMVSVATFLDGGTNQNDTLAQIPGEARRMSRTVLATAVDERPVLRRLLNRYAQAFLSQVSQTAACNRLHHIEARCARWLLMTHDRVEQAEQFPLTQEFLAIMLGVRRSGVTIAAGTLQDSGLIRYRRGGIRVLDRIGLEQAACECYGIVRQEFDRLIP